MLQFYFINLQSNNSNIVMKSFNLDILMSFLDIIEKQNRFMTSAQVVMDASGLRLEAIRSIAREQGIEIRDEQSRCIDENLLEELANAHVRRLKSYFNNTRRHISEISSADFKIFVSFCITFKKHCIYSKAVDSWDDIDTDSIREQFLKKVHDSTPEQSRCANICAKGNLFCISKFVNSNNSVCDCLPTIRLSDVGFVNLSAFKVYSANYRICAQSFSLDDTCIENFKHKEEVIYNVIHNRWFYDKPVQQYVFKENRRDSAKRIIIPARYYLFSRDEDEDHQIDTICEIAHYDYINK